MVLGMLRVPFSGVPVLTWRFYFAHPTGRLTRNGLEEKAWREYAGPLVSADTDARAILEKFADQYGCARAVRPGVEITIMRAGKYKATMRSGEEWT